MSTTCFHGKTGKYQYFQFEKNALSGAIYKEAQTTIYNLNVWTDITKQRGQTELKPLSSSSLVKFPL